MKFERVVTQLWGHRSQDNFFNPPYTFCDVQRCIKYCFHTSISILVCHRRFSNPHFLDDKCAHEPLDQRGESLNRLIFITMVRVATTEEFIWGAVKAIPRILNNRIRQFLCYCSYVEENQNSFGWKKTNKWFN